MTTPNQQSSDQTLQIAVLSHIEQQPGMEGASTDRVSEHPSYLKAIKVSVSYLLRGGLNQPEAITVARQMVEDAVLRFDAVDNGQASLSLERSVLESTIQWGIDQLRVQRVVVPEERLRPMRKAAPMRLIYTLGGKSTRS